MSQSVQDNLAGLAPPQEKRRTSKGGELLIDRPARRKGWRAGLFVAIVIVLGLLPMGLGFDIGKFAPRLPSLDWTLAIDQRVRQYAGTIHGPKIIFVGGSNFRFGLDADAISSQVHMPVVNYGLHAGLGIDVIAAQAAKIIGPGDIVVFAPELSHFRPLSDFNDDLRIDFLAEHPSEIDLPEQSFPLKQWIRMRSRCNRLRIKVERAAELSIDGLLDRFEQKDTTADDNTGNAYVVEALGDKGQIIIPRPGPRAEEHWQVSDPPKSVSELDLENSRGIVGFDVLQRRCAQQHATLCIMPPMRVRVPRLDQTLMLQLEQVVMNDLAQRGALPIMAPGDNVLDMKYGYDSDYHLNDAGVAVMEPRIVAALQLALNRGAGGQSTDKNVGRNSAAK